MHKRIKTEVSRCNDLEVDVTSNMKDFHREVKAGATDLDDVEIDVDADMSDFHDSVRTGAKNIDNAEVDVDADMAGFHQKVKTETSTIPDANVKVTPEVDTTKARAGIGAFATQMRASLTAAIKSLPEVELTADSDDVTREIQKIRQELITLRDVHIDAEFDDKAAIAQIKALEARLKALSAKNVHIKAEFDAGTAATKLAAFSLLARGAGDSGNFLGNAMKTVGSVFTSAVGGIGEMVSGLGGLVGQGNAAGSTMTKFGTSISEGASSMGKFAGPIGTVITTLGVFGPMMLAMVGMVGLGVAAIGQLGGAAVALGSGLVPLMGLLGTLPGLIAPIGLGIGALAIAFGDAGLKKEVEELGKAFQPLVSDIRDQMRPALTEMINTVEGLVPLFRRVAPVITSALSDVTRGFSNILKDTSFQNDLEFLLTAAGNNIREFGVAAQAGFRGLTDMAVAAQPAVNSLVAYIRQGAEAFAEMMAEGRRTGELAAFFQQGVEVLKQLITTVTNAAGLFKDFWESANRTGAFTAAIEAINNGITRMRDYVSQAGGSWDQLMGKVGPITEQIVSLIGTIGAAFVEIGAKVDLGPAFEGAKAAINGIKGPLADIAQATSDVIGKLGPMAGDLATAFGPNVADSIRRMGDYLGAFMQILENMGPTIGVLGTIFDDVFSSIGIAILAVTTSLDGVISVLRAGFEVITGDWSAAGDIMSDFAGRARDSGQAMGDLAFGSDAASESVDGLGTSIGNVPQPPPIKFNVDAADALAKSKGVNDAIQIVPQDWFTKFIGDPTRLNEAIAQVTGGIAAVTPSHLTAFLGDTGNILSQAGLANVGIADVPSVHGSTFTGDPSNVLAAAGQATGGINAVPPGHHTPITGDAASAVGESQRAATALTGIPTPPTIPINAQDNASGVIDRVLGKLQQLVSRAWTAVVNAVTGQALGGIVVPMALGGILPLARGDTLRPMSANLAQIVPPNTMRLIGDRMQGDEAFIPINKSSMSMAVLAETARLMGRALIPTRWLPLLRMLAPILGLAQGRVLRTDDSGRATAWADEPDPGAYKQTPSRRRRLDMSMSWLQQLLRQFVMPVIQRAMSTQGSSISTLVDTWREQVTSIQERLGQSQRHESPFRHGPAPYRGTATPTGWTPPGYGNGYSPHRPALPKTGLQGTLDAAQATGNIPPINVYAQPRQSEEAVAMMVTRRLAFSLRT